MPLLLTQRAALLAKIEAIPGVEEATSAATDGILVADPDPSVDPNVLERNFVKNDLSPLAHVIGRKLHRLRFQTELRSNGKTSSGQAADAAKIGRLFRACGYSETASAAAYASAVTEVGQHANQVSWVTGGALTNTEEISYLIRVTTGGASGVAQAEVVTDDPSVDPNLNPAIVTTGMAFTVGGKGLTCTPTFTGNLVVGQSWWVSISPAGIQYDPVSDGFETITLKLYLDGTVHTIVGAMGTFVINAASGDYGRINWDFTGQYIAPADAALVDPTYETILPQQVELAKLRVNEQFSPVAASWSYDAGNNVVPRPDVNQTDGFSGVRISGRSPSGGFDPEADLVANQDFWADFAAAKAMPFQARVGSAAGNIVWMKAPRVQYSGLTYQDRDGIRAYDAGLRYTRDSGDDEFRILFQ